MITVSNEFKNAIKSPERRIKGYVEVLYDYYLINGTLTTNINSNYCETSNIMNGVRVPANYGSLDYFHFFSIVSGAALNIYVHIFV